MVGFFSKQLPIGLFILFTLSVACTQRICPAYTQKATHEQTVAPKNMTQTEENIWDS